VNTCQGISIGLALSMPLLIVSIALACAIIVLGLAWADKLRLESLSAKKRVTHRDR